MKKLIYSICTITLALAVSAWGEEIKTKGKSVSKPAIHATGGHSAVMRTAPRMTGQVQRNVSTPRFTQRSYHPTSHMTSNATVRNNTFRNARVNTSSQITARNAKIHNQTNIAAFRNRNKTTVTGQNNVAVNRQRNFTGTRNFNVNRNRNVTVTNNWRGAQFSGRNYAAFQNYHRTWHDRGWWGSHFRIAFYFGAPYYWDAGYWYPAWGYYPDYAYEYDGPIYGYNGLAPDQIVLNVQTELQRDGYYAGPIDGVMGPMTRQAIGAYQADHGLAITSTVDEPTLATMGLT